MAPPERPLRWLVAAFPVPVLAAPLLVADGLPLEVDVNKFGKVEKTGSLTPTQSPVEFDVTQQESVAFSELARQ